MSKETLLDTVKRESGELKGLVVMEASIDMVNHASIIEDEKCKQKYNAVVNNHNGCVWGSLSSK